MQWAPRAQPQPTAAAPVDQGLRSPWRPLEARVRGEMQALLGHDFSNVRVHTDASAAASAGALTALAYTVGRDVVFGAGQYAPASAAGRRLLAHELAHVVQQPAGEASQAALADDPGAEREADAAAARAGGMSSGLGPLRVSRRQLTLQRQRAGPPTSVMTRTEFERTLLARFGIRVTTGTRDQQAAELTPHGGAPPGGVNLPGWRSWDPGAASSFYQATIDSLEDFARAIGGLPLIREIVFFDVDYQVNPTGVAIPRPDAGAAYGAGRLLIFSSATTSDKWLPVARSNAAARYPSVIIGVTGIPGQSPGAPLPLPTREQSERRILAHELGHGLAEAAMAADPHTFGDFRRAVGWTATEPAELHDVQPVGVAAASRPPAPTRTTESNWNSPLLHEQPLTDYAVSGGPAEDFAESVMAFVYTPDLLRSRSPARYRFLVTGSSTGFPTWSAFLR